MYVHIGMLYFSWRKVLTSVGIAYLYLYHVPYVYSRVGTLIVGSRFDLKI